MIGNELLNPDSIAVIGASNELSKPGGKILKNIIDGNYDGKLYAVNPKEDVIQGINCTKDINDIEHVDLAILAIAAKYIPDTVEILTQQKGTRAFIILSRLPLGRKTRVFLHDQDLHFRF